MSYGKLIVRLGVVVLPCLLLGYVRAQDKPQGRSDRDALPRPVYKVAAKLDDVDTKADAQAQAQAHPLQPALDMAFKALNKIQSDIKDYSSTLFKHERVDGKMLDTECMFIKVRNQPFSVYIYFKGPEAIRGQECLYVAGKNDGNMLAHGVGIKKIVGTVKLKPDSMLAMKDNRYPITEIGLLNLTKRLIEVAEQDKQYGECDVKFFKNGKVADRPVTLIEVTHPVPRKNFRFYKARVFVDAELGIPIRYEAYEWPSAASKSPPKLADLELEEYTYVDLKLNNGFTDADFDENNPAYGFH